MDSFVCNQCKTRLETSSLKEYIEHKLSCYAAPHITTAVCFLCSTLFHDLEHLRFHLMKTHNIALKMINEKLTLNENQRKYDGENNSICVVKPTQVDNESANASCSLSSQFKSVVRHDRLRHLPESNHKPPCSHIQMKINKPSTNEYCSTIETETIISSILPPKSSCMGEAPINPQSFSNAHHLHSYNPKVPGLEKTLKKHDMPEKVLVKNDIPNIAQSELTFTGIKQKPNDNHESTCDHLFINSRATPSSVIQQDHSQSKAKPSKVNEDFNFHFFVGNKLIHENFTTLNDVELRCMHCNFTTSWRPSLIKHMKQSHIHVLPFHEILDIRMKQTTTVNNDLRKRYRIITLSQHRELNLNKLSKNSYKKRKRSVEVQDIKGKFPCPICNKVFDRLRYARRHQMIHKPHRLYLCENCGQSFKTQSTLTNHYKTHHKVKIYHCPECDFVSDNKAAIHKHRQIHPNGGIICQTCGQSYTDKSTLRKHLQVHDKSRPFPCLHDNCTWRFQTETKLKAHVRGHETEGKFECFVCGYKFRLKHHLQRHLAKSHPNITTTNNFVSIPPLNHNSASLEYTTENSANCVSIESENPSFSQTVQFLNLPDKQFIIIDDPNSQIADSTTQIASDLFTSVPTYDQIINDDISCAQITVIPLQPDDSNSAVKTLTTTTTDHQTEMNATSMRVVLDNKQEVIVDIPPHLTFNLDQ